VLLEGSPIAMQRIAADGRALDANAAMLRLLGMTREDLAAGRIRWGELTAPEWRAADAAALAEAQARGHCSPYEKEYLLSDGRRVPVLVGLSMIDRASGEFATFAVDLTAQKRAEAARVESEREAGRRLAELELVYRTAPLGLAQLDRNLRFVRVNEALAEMNGLPVEAHLGRSAWELVPDLRATAEPVLRRVLETGEAVVDIALSGETARHPGERRDWIEQFYPLHDPETEEVVGLGVVCEEVTERRRSERARELLLRELDHRVKNLFAIISGMVTFTARTAASPEAMRAVLLGRIGALARAHDLVRPALVGGVAGMAEMPTLDQLLQAMLEPFGPGQGLPERLRLEGPPVPLGPTAAPPLALVLHELATNAARHGAISGGGRVGLAWRLQPPEEGGRVVLRWEEEDGPVLAEPGRPGFGHRLVTQSCAQLGGTASFDWRPGGLAVELLLPVDRLAR
jgi:PAS domain S-box-containing protein